MRSLVLAAIAAGLLASQSWCAELAQATRSVSLYFGSKDGKELLTEEREMLVTENREGSLSLLISELTGGPRRTGVRLMPANAVLRHTFIDERGTVFIDFSGSIRVTSQGGILFEWLLASSIARTVLENVERVKKVVFLVDGKPAATLTGHVDLTEGLTLDDILSAGRRGGMK
ncbi:MAG: GerMN domain-containing protein [Candidatus Eisenbacteria bacterium]|nr:GerMN domain-containing protein [Candidatus Eisenbacteria bacterium]